MTLSARTPNSSPPKRLRQMLAVSTTTQKPDASVGHSRGGHPKENWNCVFSEIERLNERLERLDINELMVADNA